MHFLFFQIVGVGLRSVLEIIRESRSAHLGICTKALAALLDILQGQQPEGLNAEPAEVIGQQTSILPNNLQKYPLYFKNQLLCKNFGTLLMLYDRWEKYSFNRSPHLVSIKVYWSTLSSCIIKFSDPLFDLLLDLATTTPDGPVQADGTHFTALACSCLLSLVVVRGSTSKLLSAAAALLMCPRSQTIQLPMVLTSLQRSVHAVLLGKLPRPDWLTHGVPNNATVDSFAITNSGGCLLLP